MRPPRPPRCRGLTLIELLVAMTLSLLVTLAAIGVLLASRAGYSGVDAAAQLRDHGRLAAELMTRIIVQAGYQDMTAGALTRRDASLALGEDPEPDVAGFNNALLSTADPLASVHDSRNTGCAPGADTSCANGSDILILRYHGASLAAGSSSADLSMINCAGFGEAGVFHSSADRAVSIFHVARGADGEPSLMCSYRGASGAWARAQPLIRGVETLQVLYGVDPATAHPAHPAPAAPAPGGSPFRYLRADQTGAPGGVEGMRANWRRVRSVRIGLVLRGPPGSAPDVAASAGPYFPLGKEVPTAGDPGARLTPPADGRLRQVLTFTVHLRNDLTLQ